MTAKMTPSALASEIAAQFNLNPSGDAHWIDAKLRPVVEALERIEGGRITQPEALHYGRMQDWMQDVARAALATLEGL